jgi:hypothetical protein
MFVTDIDALCLSATEQGFEANYLHIEDCNSSSETPQFPFLPFVDDVEIVNVRGIVELNGDNFPGVTSIYVHMCDDLVRISGFDSTVRICVEKCQNFEFIFSASIELLELTVSECDKFVMPQLENIRDLTLKNCKLVSVLPEMKKLESLTIVNIPVFTLPRLENMYSLEVKDCDRLLSLRDFPELRYVRVSGCENLYRLPFNEDIIGMFDILKSKRKMVIFYLNNRKNSLVNIDQKSFFENHFKFQCSKKRYSFENIHQELIGRFYTFEKIMMKYFEEGDESFFERWGMTSYQPPMGCQIDELELWLDQKNQTLFGQEFVEKLENGNFSVFDF